MEWINVKDSMPEPWDVVWIYWRNQEVLLGCKTYEGAEYRNCSPSEGWYSFEHEKCRGTNWWLPVTRASFDKPDAPKEE